MAISQSTTLLRTPGSIRVNNFKSLNVALANIDRDLNTLFDEAGTGSENHDVAVTDAAALRAVAEADRVDRDVRLVATAAGGSTTGAIYRFDATAVGADDGNLIIAPTVGSGRWIKISNFAGGGGGGVFKAGAGLESVVGPDSSYYANPVATGLYSFAMGPKAKAQGSNAVAFGYYAYATNGNAFAHGRQATASGVASFAHGNSLSASGYYAVAFGRNANANADRTFAHGYSFTIPTTSHDTVAFGYAHTIGASTYNSFIQGYSHVLGANANSSFVQGTSHTVGAGAYSSFCQGGSNTIGTNGNCFSQGGNCQSTGASSFSQGDSAYATGQASFAHGTAVTASSSATFASGENCSATMFAATSFGYSSYATGSYAFAAGYGNTASGTASFAVGNNCTASGGSCLAQGQYVTAPPGNNFVQGSYITHTGQASFAQGYTHTIGTGFSYGFIQGGNNTVGNSSSHCFLQGSYNTIDASSQDSFAQGRQNRVTGAAASAHGAYAHAKFAQSHMWSAGRDELGKAQAGFSVHYLQTTNASPDMTIALIPLDLASALNLSVKITGRGPVGEVLWTDLLDVQVYRDAAGAILNGAPTFTVSLVGLSSATADVVASGDDLLVRVTGEGGTTIDWTCKVFNVEAVT